MDGERQPSELIPQPTALQPGSTPWTKGLGSLLLSEDGDGPSKTREGAIRLIAINPTLRAECERLLPALQEAKRPATEQEIIHAIGRAMPAWGVSTKQAGEWGVTYASYVDALEGMPLWAIEEGIVRWNRGEGHKDLAMGGFPPRPAQLCILANEARRELFMAAYRAELAVKYVEQKAPRQVSDEERQAVRDGLKQLALNFRTRAIPDAPAPTRSRQELAAQLLAKAERHEDVGDVV